MILNKVCELEDFAGTDLSAVVTKYLPKPFVDKADWPVGMEDRKFWEIAMALLAVERHVLPSQRHKALGVGAGTEATSFILTKMFEQVFATDLYGGRAWNSDAPVLMLARPEEYSGSITFNPRRLVVQHMDGTSLRYEDESFDFIYSSSSIEHFGAPTQISAAAQEMSRVLKCGGILSISTELRIAGEMKRLNANTLLLDRDAIEELIVKPSGCKRLDGPSFEVSTATRRGRTTFETAVKEVSGCANRLQKVWSNYPHVVMSDQGVDWTSVHICLKKDSRDK